jgi:hypothetical protein
MMGGCGSAGRRAAGALVCLATMWASAAACVGGGDDTVAPAAAADAGDAGGHDGSAVDATVGGGGNDSGPSSSSGGGAPDGSGTAIGAGQPTAILSSAPIDFGAVPCGAAAVTQTLTVGNTGGGPLAISAATTGTAFSVSPTQLTVLPGASASLIVTATVQGSATAGAPLTGSLGVFTNDPTHGNVAIRLSATPTGATIALAPGSQSPLSFPATPVGAAPAVETLSITNNGNAPATISVAAPSPAVGFSFLPDGLSADTPVVVAAQATLSTSVQFAPTTGSSGQPLTASSAVTATGTALCGTSLSSVSFTGAAILGSLTGWPSQIDFGNVDCGAVAPAPQTFTLVNTGVADVTVTGCQIVSATGASTGCAVGGSPDAGVAAPGFAVAIPGTRIAGGGGTLVFTVSAPAVPGTASETPIDGTLGITTDPPISPSLTPVLLREQPTGAVLQLDPSSSGTFGAPIVLLGPQATQAFNVENTGNWPPSGGVGVTLAVVPNATPALVDGGQDATVAPPRAFAVLSPTLVVPTGGAATERNDTLQFSPLVAGINSATLTMTVDPATPLCAPLPSMTLIGTGTGGGASIVPTSLSFLAPCDGTPPAAQPFTITNSGDRDLDWTMSAATGPGAARYSAVATPAPGLLHPGQSAMVMVTASPFLALPPGSAPLNPDPAALAAQIVIATDAPGPAHVISLGEIPVGDQLSFSVPGSIAGSSPSLQFGQFPVGQTTIAQGFGVTNDANPGSADAMISLVVQGAGASAYSLVPPVVGANLGAGGGLVAEGVTFSPAVASQYPASIAIVTSDTALCAPLPPEIRLTGTGTAGHVSVSPGTLTFGEGAAGFVDCGSTGAPQAITLANAVSSVGGNQPFNVTAIALGKQGAGAPFAFSTSAATAPPFGLPVGASVQITVTPSPIPQTADPGDVSAFHDTLTITTDAAGDAPHVVPLVMQARGAVIAADPPLATTWSFGTITAGSIGTFTSTIQNTGNAPVSIALEGLAQPTIFGLATSAEDSGFTSIVGQFTPPALDGSWTDQGTLVVTPTQGLCMTALPPQWQRPTIHVSGSSNSNAPVTISGTALAFPTTDCGTASPAGQTITLTNDTNQPQTYAAQILSSVHPNTYAIDNASGTIPAMGVATVLVTPLAITPGPGVVAGSYAATLEIEIATTPATTYSIPIAWSLNGAVLSLTPGGTPFTDGNGDPFYAADTTSGHLLPMSNTGTAAVTVDFAIQPPGAFTFLPSLPVSLPAGLGASPQLQDLSATPACVPSPLFAGTATFLYVSGPVCQPFVRASGGGAQVATPAVSIHYCAGTF